MAAPFDKKVDIDIDHTEHEEVPKTEAMSHKEYAGATSDLTFHTTGLMIFFSIVIGFSGWILNFDIGYSGTVYQMQPFVKAFGSCAMVPASTVPHAPPGATGLVNYCHLTATAQSVGASVHILAMALGAALSGVTANYLGRRGSLQLGCLIIIVGAAGMLGTTGHYVSYVVCKFIGAVGIGTLQTMAPVYAVECTPPHRRGFLLALFTVGGGLGNLVVACVCLSSSTFKNDWSWKTPIICQIPIALLYGGLLIIFPESPRWLLTKGKDDKARRSFGRFYNRQPDSPEVSAQVAEVQAAIEEEKAIASTTTWTEIFHRKSIRRTLIATIIPVGTSLSGGLAIFTYAAIFLAGLGIKSPFLINVIINVCVVAGTFLGPVNLDWLGRRVTILSGHVGMSICMLIFAAVSSGLGATNEHTQRVVVAFLCIWAFIFGGFLATTMWVASAEMHAVRLRTYGQAFTITANNIFQFGSSFWTPYMINKDYGNMGTNVGYFYFGIEVVIIFIIFFTVPENARLPLELIDDFFQRGGKAWKTSLAKNKQIVRDRTAQQVEVK